MIRKLWLFGLVMLLHVSYVYAQEGGINQVVSMEAISDNTEYDELGKGFVGCYWYNFGGEGPLTNGISIIDENTGAQNNTDITNIVSGEKLYGPNKFVGISFIPVHIVYYENVATSNNPAPDGNTQHGIMKVFKVDLVANINIGNGNKKLIFINSQSKKFIYGPDLWTSSANKLEYDFMHNELVADQFYPGSSQNGSAVTVDMMTGGSGYVNDWWKPNGIAKVGFSFSEDYGNINPSNDRTTLLTLIGVLNNYPYPHYLNLQLDNYVNTPWYFMGPNYGLDWIAAKVSTMAEQNLLFDTRRSLEDNDRLNYFSQEQRAGVLYISYGDRAGSGPAKFYIGEMGTTQGAMNMPVALTVTVDRFLEDMSYKK